jgi:hypothetical protein
MKKHLFNSTASSAAGICPAKRVFRVPSGTYAGRIAVLAQTSPTEIKLAYADYPYDDWIGPLNVINDAADRPFDAVMDEDGHIYVACIRQTSGDLVVRKLTFSSGGWSVGPAGTVYTGDENHYPSIVIQDQPRRLWVSWSRLSSGQYYVNAKYSDDDGQLWGTGPSSFGYELSDADSSACSRLIMMASYLYAFYTHGATKLSYRRKHINVSLWEDEETIVAGSGYDHNFDVAVSGDQHLGVVFCDPAVRYREFNGNTWSGIVDIDTDDAAFPQLQFIANDPVVAYLSGTNGAPKRILWSRKKESSFSVPEPLDTAASDFDSVFCYNSVSADFADLTAPAADSAAADVYHPDSMALIAQVGDALYLGMNAPFHYLKIILSTAAVGGNVSWQYFNGEQWIGFLPAGGQYAFGDNDKELLLWDDYDAVPSDWQKNVVADRNLFWIRVVVAAPFATPPVGSRLTAVSNVESLVLMEP